MEVKRIVKRILVAIFSVISLLSALCAGCGVSSPPKIQFEKIAELRGHDEEISSITFNGAGDRLISTGAMDGKFYLWSIPEGKLIGRIQAHEKFICRAVLTSNESLIATSGGDTAANVRIWDANTGRLINTITDRGDSVVCPVAFLKDMSTLVYSSATLPAQIKLWDYKMNKEVASARGHTNIVNNLIFSPNGSLLISSGDDKTIRIWDTATFSEMKTLVGHTGIIDDLAVSNSNDGLMVASAGSDDNTARIWDVKTGKELKKFSGMGKVFSVAFSPDNKVLATASKDEKGIRIWDIKTGKLAIDNLGNIGKDLSVNWIRFSNNGKYFATAVSNDKEFILVYKVVSPE